MSEITQEEIDDILAIARDIKVLKAELTKKKNILATKASHIQGFDSELGKLFIQDKKAKKADYDIEPVHVLEDKIKAIKKQNIRANYQKLYELDKQRFLLNLKIDQILLGNAGRERIIELENLKQKIKKQFQDRKFQIMVKV